MRPHHHYGRNSKFAKYYYHSNVFVRILLITGWVLLALIGISAFASLAGYGVMLFWNWVMPGIFGLGEITFWQAIGILILSKLIFGGFHHGHHPHGRYPQGRPGSLHHEKHCGDWQYYDSYWEEEGKEAFRQYVERKGKNEGDRAE